MKPFQTRRTFTAGLLAVLFSITCLQAVVAQAATPSKATTMNVEQTQQALLGEWRSIAPELRPSLTKNADGSMKPFYLTRDFTFAAGNQFSLDVINYADPYGKVPLVKIAIKGHIVWQGEHAIAAGAQKVDFIADKAFDVTPLHAGFAGAMNQLPGSTLKWEVNAVQNLQGKSFAPFGLVAGQTYTEYDLIYIRDGMLFWGAKNVDGRGFDKLENRPTNLQIPLVRK